MKKKYNINNFLSAKLFLNFRRLGRATGINKYIRLLFDFKDYQVNFDQIMLNTLLEQDTFWDVGSNQGEIVKQVKSLFGEEVYCIAFEPHPILSDNLKKIRF